MSANTFNWNQSEDLLCGKGLTNKNVSPIFENKIGQALYQIIHGFYQPWEKLSFENIVNPFSWRKTQIIV